MDPKDGKKEAESTPLAAVSHNNKSKKKKPSPIKSISTTKTKATIGGAERVVSSKATKKQGGKKDKAEGGKGSNKAGKSTTVPSLSLEDRISRPLACPR
jgi:hypothetical protein